MSTHLTRAHVIQARALWTVLAAGFEDRLAKIHRDMERAEDLPTLRALQAEAHATRAFIDLPDRLDAQVTLQEQAAKETTHVGT